jgi:hypothetical protein
MDLQLVEGIVRMRACVNNPGTFIFLFYDQARLPTPFLPGTPETKKFIFPPHHHFVKSNKTGRGSKKKIRYWTVHA